MNWTTEQKALLYDLALYLDQKADVQYFPDRPEPVGNEEASLLARLNYYFPTS